MPALGCRSLCKEGVIELSTSLSLLSAAQDVIFLKSAKFKKRQKNKTDQPLVICLITPVTLDIKVCICPIDLPADNIRSCVNPCTFPVVPLKVFKFIVGVGELKLHGVSIDSGKCR